MTPVFPAGGGDSPAKQRNDGPAPSWDNSLPPTWDGAPAPAWEYDADADAEKQSQTLDLTPGLVSLAFIRAAMRRRARFWVTLGIIGLLAGAAMYVKFPPAYQATTSVLVNDGPNADYTVTISTDAALAESRAVAGHVVRQLGLQQSVSSFLSSYKVTTVTDQLLSITVGAPSSQAAKTQVAAVAAAFIKIHGDYAKNQQHELTTELNQQVTQAKQKVDAITAKINRLSAETPTSEVQAQLNSLKTQQTAASDALQQVQGVVSSNLSSGQTVTDTILNGTLVVDDPTALAPSKVKGPLLYVGGGLVVGLVIGMGIVIVTALMSDRLRYRDDVADALEAPVMLSVGPLPGRRRLLRLPGKARGSKLGMQRVVTCLGRTVAGSRRGLAVVAVDNEPATASTITSLAFSRAREGQRVVLADLSSGAWAARLLQVKEPGIRPVNRDGAQLTVVIPDPADVAPIGPLTGGRSPGEDAPPDQALVSACSSADLVLTFATLDPSVGGGYLATWAGGAVVIVTAGHSTSTRLHAVGEMIRLGGTRLLGAVLINADATDETLGTTPEPVQDRADRLYGRRSQKDPDYSRRDGAATE